MDLSIVKTHPYATGAVVIVGAVLLFVVMKNRNGSTASAPDGSGGDVALAQAAAGQAAANAASNGAIQVAQIQGQVASNQIAAELTASQSHDATALAIVQTQTAGQVDQTQITADSNTAMAVANANAATQISANQTNAVLGVANLEAGVATLQVGVMSKNADNEAAIIAAAGRDKSRSSTGWAQIISAFKGQGPAAIAANQPSAVASSPSSILSALNPAKLLASFFG